MDIKFESNTKRKHVIYRNDGKPDIQFDKGDLVTQDKDEIDYIFGTADFEREEIGLKTPPELVEQYLKDGEADKINLEVLDSVTKEGMKELADYFQLKGHGYYPEVMKRMLVGRYIDNRAKDIIDSNQLGEGDEKVDDILELAMDKGIVVHNAPWYKFVALDKGIGRSEPEATKWLVKNKDKVEEELEKLKGE